ncbi:DUF1579 domain-containing protein [Chitinophaga pendula]|uniref:DUF1579 domain-containing protein n=1 Tax=Chitinophaga TaxID=79328 RepID=UPI000BB05770|nr:MULTISPECIES: DUF1579 domain-containing protein [Chitinophaga]ASZ11394.1 hypothetical protein CK934_10690 [Chitinophaga sp. MD30]UCJ05602.1 DUF1579 domain-containing protein [Chitinophaga pendula]
MKRLSVITCLLAGLLLSFLPSKAQNDQQNNEKAWTAYMTPGPIHKMIAAADGEWDFEMTAWMQPGAPPSKSKGTAVNKMILGGRYQETHNKAQFMNMPYEGIGMLAYDNAKKVFQSTYMDNMGTGIMNMEGTWDETSKSIEFKGISVDPSTGKDLRMREVFRLVDNDHQTMEMYCDINGQEMKMMEIQFTRKKK